MGDILSQNALYRNIYTWFDGFAPAWVTYAVAGFTIAFLLANALLVFTMLYTYLERRLLGRFQVRLGPNRTGPFGILQPVADAIKLLTKEDIVPAVADRWVFNLAPVVMLLSSIMVLAVVPLGKNSYLTNLNIGILYVIAVSSLSSLAMFMAGWSSGNKFALIGAVRAVAQLISYEIPVVLSIVGILIMAGSMSMVTIVESQRLPFILLQPLGFLIFIAGTSAELNRSPFDLVEAESEIVSGYHTEYSGMKWGLFQAAEFGAVLVSSAIMATLFLKGWEGPFLPSHLWFLIKVFFFAYLMVWLRATLPRLRVDQIMGFAWKFLFPLSLINIFVTAAEALIWPEPTTVQLWAMVVINFVVAGVSVAGFGRLIARPSPVAVPRSIVRVATEAR